GRRGHGEVNVAAPDAVLLNPGNATHGARADGGDHLGVAPRYDQPRRAAQPNHAATLSRPEPGAGERDGGSGSSPVRADAGKLRLLDGEWNRIAHHAILQIPGVAGKRPQDGAAPSEQGRSSIAKWRELRRR